MTQARTNDKPGERRHDEPMELEPGFERHVVSEARSVTADALRDVRTGRATGRVNGDELGEPCDGNPEPSVEAEENALVGTASMACVETRCHPLPCGGLGDEGIVRSSANQEAGGQATNGASEVAVGPAGNKRGGIYAIINRINGKQYIGSTRDFAMRWQIHRSRLSRGVHHSPALQSAWKKYGKDVFAFEELEISSDLAALYGLEQRYMDSLRPAYNVGPVAGSPRGVKRKPDAEARRLEATRKFYEDPENRDRVNAARAEKMRDQWADSEVRARRTAVARARPDGSRVARSHHRPDWTPEMDVVLRNEYPITGSAVASRLGVSNSAVRHRAMRLGIVCTVKLGGRKRRDSA